MTATGLAVDAWTHADLAARYDPNQVSGGFSQGDLFRLEAGVSVGAAVLLLLTPRLAAWAFAWLVAGSALGALLLYRYHDLGAIGPLPDMYEPLWFPEKALAGIAEAVALVTATGGLLLHRSSSRAASSSEARATATSERSERPPGRGGTSGGAGRPPGLTLRG